ncbi:MAG: glycosyltransferase [Lachnospiraceae bacterium]|nr:glycosyltransferase [Lachnospiraceae bacterium]
MPKNIESCVPKENSTGCELISIVVPVYNVEAYVDICVCTLVAQSYRNIEILLVDDGSTDSSGSLCKRWAEKDSRVIYIHKENGGAASARNAALDVCRGQLITFVDSDDYIDENYIEVLYRAMKAEDADISICGWKNETSSGIGASDTSRGTVCYDKTEALKKLFYQEDYDTAMWAKLYRAELFEAIRFPVGNIYEDIAIIYKVFELAEKVVYSEYAGYHYLLRDTGTTLKTFSKKKMDLIDVADEMEEYVLKHCPGVSDAMKSKYVRANFHIYLQIPRTDEFKEERARIEKNIDKYRKSVLKDARTRKGTKAALLLSGISYGMFYGLKKWKQLGK